MQTSSVAAKIRIIIDNTNFLARKISQKWISLTYLYLIMLNHAIKLKKNKRRISQKGDSNCLMGFFDARGWIIMAFMITLGVSIRRYELMPLWFIAPFYTGLSSALVLTGIRFLFSSKFWNRKSVG